MKIQYCSDLHLEFPENRRYLKENPIESVGDILILAGDILPFALNDKDYEFFNDVSSEFETVYWLPGNHEYYYSDISTFENEQFRQIRENVFVVDNVQVDLDGITLYFSTLWSYIKPENEFDIRQGVSDFHVIKYNTGAFLPEHFNRLHHSALEFLNQISRERRQVQSVMITHHVPTLINYPKKYKNSPVNNAFAVELFDFIQQSHFDYWIFGHHHTNIPGFEIGKTKMITNQLGYVKYNEQKGFSIQRIIEL
ncbi:MAG: metallophosphoesterase [Chlorobi bacterium]|nr:metallophosphoesterase [Chlorobiota bacterium]